MVGNNKLRILRLVDILNTHSDEEHPLTLNMLAEHLKGYGIASERKSLYADLEALREYGLDIEVNRAKNTGYYIASRAFETAELKLLVDAVQASRFITARKSRELIRKLEGLTSQFEAKKLNRQIYTNENTKSINESIYYNVDKLHSAIQQEVQVSFLYFDIAVDKSKIYRNGGARYFVSPYSLVWADDLYYLVGFYSKYDKISHFRVDRMSDMEVTNLPRVYEDGQENIDMNEYLKKQFHMYSGETDRVRIRFDMSLLNAVIDKFGIGVGIEEYDLTTFTINEKVAVSPTFFGWVMQFGTRAKILGPDYVAEQIARSAYEIYVNTLGDKSGIK